MAVAEHPTPPLLGHITSSLPTAIPPLHHSVTSPATSAPAPSGQGLGTSSRCCRLSAVHRFGRVTSRRSAGARPVRRWFPRTSGADLAECSRRTYVFVFGTSPQASDLGLFCKEGFAEVNAYARRARFEVRRGRARVLSCRAADGAEHSADRRLRVAGVAKTDVSADVTCSSISSRLRRQLSAGPTRPSRSRAAATQLGWRPYRWEGMSRPAAQSTTSWASRRCRVSSRAAEATQCAASLR